MAESIKVSTQVLRDTSDKVKNINSRMDEKLKEINRKMQELSSSWHSDAAEEIRAKMNGMNPRFEEYKAVVESYASFLLKTAELYEQTEQNIQQNASQFR